MKWSIDCVVYQIFNQNNPKIFSPELTFWSFWFEEIRFIGNWLSFQVSMHFCQMGYYCNSIFSKKTLNSMKLNSTASYRWHNSLICLEDNLLTYFLNILDFLNLTKIKVHEKKRMNNIRIESETTISIISITETISLISTYMLKITCTIFAGKPTLLTGFFMPHIRDWIHNFQKVSVFQIDKNCYLWVYYTILFDFYLFWHYLYTFVGTTFQLLTIPYLAKGHWWGFKTRNVHMVFNPILKLCIHLRRNLFLCLTSIFLISVFQIDTNCNFIFICWWFLRSRSKEVNWRKLL